MVERKQPMATPLFRPPRRRHPARHFSPAPPERDGAAQPPSMRTSPSRADQDDKQRILCRGRLSAVVGTGTTGGHIRSAKSGKNVLRYPNVAQRRHDSKQKAHRTSAGIATRHDRWHGARLRSHCRRLAFSFRNVTQARLLERSLRESERRQRFLAESALELQGLAGRLRQSGIGARDDGRSYRSRLRRRRRARSR